MTITRAQFEAAVKELNIWVSPVGLQAITYEYTDYLAGEDNSTALMLALDRMVGDFQFTCPTVAFADRYAEAYNKVYQYYFDHRASVHPWPNWTGVLHADEIAFVFGEPLDPEKGYTAEEQALRQQLYGLNSIDVEVQSYGKLLVEEVLNPFYIFQAASMVLWSFDNYVFYASCILFISLLSIAISLRETRAQSQRVHDMVALSNAQSATVKRKRMKNHNQKYKTTTRS